MSAGQILLFTILFLAVTSCVITGNVVFYQIMTEVNTQRSLRERYDVISMSLRAPEIVREHKRLFPQSAKRKRMLIWIGVGFVLMLVMISFVL